MAKQTMEDLDLEIKRIQHEAALITLEQARDSNEAYKASKEVRSRQNKQRQGQLRADLVEKAAAIKGCTHRQGGGPGGRERKGKGPSALRVVFLPDERELVMCANCPLRVFSPFPRLASKDLLEGETQADRKARLSTYAEERAEFEELLEKAADQLTPEAAAPMHCGKQFKFIGRNGNQVMMPAPCDEYAQGRDNRNVA
jgi:hypothetical protein